MRRFLLLLLVVTTALGQVSTETGTTDTKDVTTANLNITSAERTDETNFSNSSTSATTDVGPSSTPAGHETTTNDTSSSTPAQSSSPVVTTDVVSSTATPHVVTDTTTAPPATPKPSVNFDKTGTWRATGDDNSTCLKIVMAAQFAVTYLHKDGHNVTTHINLMPNATESDHSCGNVTNTLQVNWLDYVFYLKFSNQFNKSSGDSRVKYGLEKLVFEYTINDADFPGAVDMGKRKVTYTRAQSDEPKLAGHVKQSYMCSAETTVTLQGIETVSASVTFKDVQYQAFGVHDDKFGDVEECASDDKTDDIVPIAVGCALAGLVIIVLIAYLVGRRRSRQKGYQSV